AGTEDDLRLPVAVDVAHAGGRTQLLVSEERPQQLTAAADGPHDPAPMIDWTAGSGVAADDDVGLSVTVHVGQRRRREPGVVGVEGPSAIGATALVDAPHLQAQRTCGDVGSAVIVHVTEGWAGMHSQLAGVGVSGM